jgi:hypothetical protein
MKKKEKNMTVVDLILITDLVMAVLVVDLT